MNILIQYVCAAIALGATYAYFLFIVFVYSKNVWRRWNSNSDITKQKMDNNKEREKNNVATRESFSCSYCDNGFLNIAWNWKWSMSNAQCSMRQTSGKRKNVFGFMLLGTDNIWNGTETNKDCSSKLNGIELNWKLDCIESRKTVFFMKRLNDQKEHLSFDPQNEESSKINFNWKLHRFPVFLLSTAIRTS